MSSEEPQKPTSSTNKDQDNENESTDTTAADHHHSDPLFRSERELWQKVHTKAQHTRPPRGGPHRGRRTANATRGAASRSVPHQNQHDDGRQPIRGRGTRGRRGRGISTNTPGRGHGRGGKLIIDIVVVN